MPSDISTVRGNQSVEELRRELAEAREQQAATAAVLKVISGSALNLQRVFDALVESSARLCNAYDAAIFQVVGDRLHLVAHLGQIPFSTAVSQHTQPLIRGLVAGRAVIDRRTIHVIDILAEADEYPESRGFALRTGFRTALGIPLVHAGEAIGVILIRRAEVRPFTERQIGLVNTFADQAVIAIENTRLFEAEQTRTRELAERSKELTESLEYQTAISEVLNVISRSPSDLQPVLDVIVETAVRLCQADIADFRLVRDGLYHIAATTLNEPARVKTLRENPIAPGHSSVVGRVAPERRTVHVPDIHADSEYDYAPGPTFPGMRAILGVPLLRDGKVIGAIVLFNSIVKPFTQNQIALVTTFANQALIAIENTRLFEAEQAGKRELQESLEHQTATSEVLNVISRSKFDLQPVLDSIARTASVSCELADTAIILREGNWLRTAAHHGSISTGGPRPIDRSSISGRSVLDRVPVHVHDVAAERDEFPLAYEVSKQHGHRTSLGIPLLHEDQAIGCLCLRRLVVQPFTDKQITLLQTFADQAVVAIENTRLFEEIAQKTRELEIASQHKSQFVANMSHELRTPLAAMLGYAELLQEGIYGAPPEKFLPILTCIRSNGKHLLGLINTVLDISKIEAGQFKLNIGEYALGSIVETVVVATESLASAKKLALKTEVTKELPCGIGDEQRLTQVLLNLVGNAIKFTDAGEVRITAGAENGHFMVCVSDTGPSIPAEECERIFEKFRQVDSSNTRAKGGTGLGLAIAREIVAMHGGRIWAESRLGQGSTFHMELPVRAAAAAGAA